MSAEAISAALAGRYTIEGEIGSGGMADVYLAFDERHERRVAVKVLRHRHADVVGLERFLREIKIAASLTHPNIVPLYDSGEAGGLLYYVMPFIEGESLRDRLNREKQLPLEDALDIASQVGAALSYAHSHGVVHRDIKPDNVLLSSGQAVVADFGLARALHALGAGSTSGLTGIGISLGTPTYMSPEQAAGRDDVDARSDQYSLACTLFEALAGEPPFTGQSVRSILAKQMTASAPSLTDMRDVVPESVAAAVKRALSKTPADRFPTVSQFTSAWRSSTPASGEAPATVRPARRFGRTQRWAAVGVSLTAIVAVVFLLSGSQRVAFDERDWIMISDFANETGDTLFDGTLDRALAVALQQSQYVNVFPRSRVAETLAYMGRPDSATLNEALARELALRQNMRVVAAPTISRLGALYVLTINLVDPESGAVLASRSARVEEPEEVLGALDGLVRQLRGDLGESLLSRLRQNVRLDQATTPSLEALRAWTAGNRQWNVGQLDAAGQLYQRAVELDSNFAMAHLDLGQYYYWRRDDRDRGDAHFEKALTLRNRVTDRERLIIEAKSAGWQGNRLRAIDAYTVLLAEYPDDAVSWSNLGYEFLRLGRWEQAAEAYRRGIELDSLNHNAMVNMATVLNGAGRYEESVEAYERAFALSPAYRAYPNINHEYGYTLIALGRFEDAEAIFRELLSGDREQQSVGNRHLAELRMYRGRYDDAITHFRRAVLLDETGAGGTTALRNRTYVAAALLTRGNVDSARTALVRALDILDTAYVAPVFLATYGRLLAQVGAVETARTVLRLLESRVNEGNDPDQASRLFLAGEIWLAEGNIDSARANLERSAVLLNQPNHLYLRSLAVTQILSGQTTEARETLESIVSNRTSGRESQEHWILAHYELARLYDDAGETDRAVEMYDRFLNLWAEADEGMPNVEEARERLTELTQR